VAQLQLLEATLSEIRWHGSNFGGPKFLIGAVDTGVSVKGEMDRPIIGERYKFWGEMRPQKPGRGGRQFPDSFEFTSFEVSVDGSASGAKKYLANYVSSLGPVKSRALADHFGGETIAVLRSNPDRALEVGGITPKNVEEIKAHFASALTFDPAAYARLSDLLSQQKSFGEKLIRTVLSDLGSEAPELVKANPYLLLAYPRTGWPSVDALAMDACGYSPTGLERHCACIVEALTKNSAEQGHTYLDKSDIEFQANKLMGMKPLQQAWTRCLEKGMIVSDEYDEMVAMLRRESNAGALITTGLDDFDADLDEEEAEAAEAKRDYDVCHTLIDPTEIEIRQDSLFMLPDLALAERSVAERMAALAKAAKPLPFKIDREGLKAGQCDAATVIEENGVVLLVGAPGTGKSYLEARVVRDYLDHCPRDVVRLCAPTGKAAKRAAELLLDAGVEPEDAPSSTIHRLLEPVPSGATGPKSDTAKLNRSTSAFRFTRNKMNPVEADFVVVDEFSMTDIRIAKALFEAIRLGTRVLIVGDPHQLPSVGPGSVLRDFLAAKLPTARLDEIVRSDGGGTVVQACHAVKDGRVPRPIPKGEKVDLPTKNWLHIEIEDPAAIADEIVSLVGNEMKTFPNKVWDKQVISPEKKKPFIGCNDLNRRISAILNPQPPDAFADNPKFDPIFRIGDKVVRTKNGMANDLTDDPTAIGSKWSWRGKRWLLGDTDIVNGDTGTVEDIYEDKELKETFVVVRFTNPDRLCRLPFKDAHLIPAYCMTIHKVQGSGYPCVIMPVHSGFYWNEQTGTGLASRELLYTGISRITKLLITVGQFSAIERMVSRPTINQRRTRLLTLINRAKEDLDDQLDPEIEDEELQCGGTLADGAEIVARAHEIQDIESTIAEIKQSKLYTNPDWTIPDPSFTSYPPAPKSPADEYDDLMAPPETDVEARDEDKPFSCVSDEEDCPF
jgi:exodeoxyribonuclease V alpha subunit